MGLLWYIHMYVLIIHVLLCLILQCCPALEYYTAVLSRIREQGTGGK